MTLNTTYTTGGSGVEAGQVIMSIDLLLGDLADGPYREIIDYGEAGVTSFGIDSSEVSDVSLPTDTPDSFFLEDQLYNGSIGTDITAIPSGWTEVSRFLYCPDRCQDENKITFPVAFRHAANVYFVDAVNYQPDSPIDVNACFQQDLCDYDGQGSNVELENTCSTLNNPLISGKNPQYIVDYAGCASDVDPVGAVWVTNDCGQYILNYGIVGVVRLFYDENTANETYRWYVVSDATLTVGIINTNLSHAEFGDEVEAVMVAMSAKYVGTTITPVFPANITCPKIEEWNHKWRRSGAWFATSNVVEHTAAAAQDD